MKQLFLLTIITLTGWAAAAQKCKYVAEEADPFTKKTTYNSRQVIGPLLGGWTFILRQEGDTYFIGVGSQNGKGTTDKLPKGSKILFMLDDESTIEIVTSKEYESVPDDVVGNGFMQWVVCEKVPKATFAKFGASPIKALKTSFLFKGNKQEFLLPGIKEKQRERIMATAACMAEN